MSYAIRRRAAAFAAAGLLAGLPLLGVSSAAAAEPEAAPGVSFSGGGLGLLLCGSKPAQPKITVNAEAKVRLTNGLGQGATLQIDGKDSASVSDGETVEVQFHRGPVKVAMVPECLLNLNPTFEPLTVDVVSRSTDTPSGGGQATAAPTKKPSSKPSPKASSQPSRPQPGTQTAPGTPSDESSTEPGVNVPEPDKTLFPAPGEGDDAAGPGGVEPSSAVVVQNERVRTIDASTSSPDKGPIGLLAIIATVCVVGVSAGAIRAIIAQRASRAEFA